MVILYLSIPHSACLNFLEKDFENRVSKQIPISHLVKMAKFVLRNNYFEFSENFFQQISGTAKARTKFAPHIHVSIWMK